MTLSTRSPIAHRQTIPVVRLVDVDGTGSRKPYAFGADVGWVLETTCQMLFVHGGEIVREGSTHNDFYGPCTSGEEMTKDAARTCEIYGVDRSSSMSIELRMRLVATAVLPGTLPEKTFGRDQYRLVPDDWFHGGAEEGETILRFQSGGDVGFDALPPKVGQTEKVVATRTIWTSKASVEENAASVEEVVQEFGALIRKADPEVLGLPEPAVAA